MTMGLKIHRMLKDETRDIPELIVEAGKRKKESDSILETIYNRIISRKSVKKRSDILEDDDDDL
jgi:hypothetical protein